MKMEKAKKGASVLLLSTLLGGTLTAPSTTIIASAQGLTAQETLVVPSVAATEIQPFLDINIPGGPITQTVEIPRQVLYDNAPSGLAGGFIRAAIRVVLPRPTDTLSVDLVVRGVRFPELNNPASLIRVPALPNANAEFQTSERLNRLHIGALVSNQFLVDAGADNVHFGIAPISMMLNARVENLNTGNAIFDNFARPLIDVLINQRLQSTHVAQWTGINISAPVTGGIVRNVTNNRDGSFTVDYIAHTDIIRFNMRDIGGIELNPDFFDVVGIQFDLDVDFLREHLPETAIPLPPAIVRTTTRAVQN